MEVLDENALMLSNFEVYTLLKDLQSGQKGHKKPSKHQQNLATISYETVKFLEKTPCKDQNEEIIRNFLQALSSFKLTRAEKLQLLNHRPTSAVEIQLLIEESEERLTESEIDELLVAIATHLPGPVEDAEPMEEGQQ